MKRTKFRSLFYIAWWLFLFCAGAALLYWSEQIPLLRPRFWEVLPQIQQPSWVPIQSDELLKAVNTGREEQDLKLPQQDITLDKLARLITLEIEDRQTLELDTEVEEILLSLNETKPQKLESLLLFFPEFTERSQLDDIASNESFLDQNLNRIGVATRSAELQGRKGVIAAVILSSQLPSAPQAVKTSEPVGNFTGQELWEAVQNYRRAHGLALFTQSNELCTVASIRVNELLELGKLDNHDGFQPRADEFFERHKNDGWTSINENLAQGYPTAVQTVEWGWDQSLGHQALLKSTEYPKACTAANQTFSVLITGK